MTRSGRSSLTEKQDVVEDLSTWEFVDASPSDDEDLYSSDGNDVILDELEGKPVENEEEEEVEYARESRDFRPLDGLLSVESLCASTPATFLADVARHYMYHRGGHVYDDQEEEGVYDDDDDVDDGLLTWKLMQRFEKQRIRKTGRRGGGGPKLSKSKRLPYYYNRPGCLYGKHGLGVQHYYI